MQSYARSLVHVVRLPPVGPGPSADRGQGHGSGEPGCTQSRLENTGNIEIADGRDSSAVPGMQQRGRGRGGRGSSRGAGRGASWSAALRSASLLSLDRERDRDSIATDRSNDGFEMPSYAMRNQRRKEKSDWG